MGLTKVGTPGESSDVEEPVRCDAGPPRTPPPPPPPPPPRSLLGRAAHISLASSGHQLIGTL